MKSVALPAVLFAFAALAAGAKASVPLPKPVVSVQQSCPAAPAVARAYLASQGARKLTMSRANVIAEVTKLTGADGEFAGLKPCDSGYPNAVRFYIDEVIKAGTNNSTP